MAEKWEQMTVSLLPFRMIKGGSAGRRVPLEIRLWSGAVECENGCWVWGRSLRGTKYGGLVRDGKGVAAHRAAWELAKGPIPEGMTIDHLCRNTLCINPSHLEVVTLRENVLRSEGIAAREARQTHCKYGHEFTEANTYRLPSKRSRYCRECKRQKERVGGRLGAESEHRKYRDGAVRLVVSDTQEDR